MNDRAKRAHVSDLLASFERDELGADERSRVESHLNDCPECREELAGLKLLMSVEEVKLDDLERARLHSSVAEGLDPTEAPEEDSLAVWLPERKSVWSRFAPSLGAAALLLVAVIAGLTAGGGSGGDDSGGGEGAAVERLNEQSGGDSKGGSSKPQGSAPKPEGAPAADAEVEEDQLDSTTDSGSSDFAAAGPEPRFDHVARLAKESSERGLGDVVSMNYWRSYAQGYTVRDAVRYEGDAVLALKDSAPEEIRGRVNWCANNVLQNYDEPLLAAYGSLGEIESVRTLVLGFVYSRRDQGPLDRYIVRSWDSCAGSFRHLEGRIEN
jgi:Putative zinc-finger